MKIYLSVVLLISMPRFSFEQRKAAVIDSLMSQLYHNEQFNGEVLVAEKGNIEYSNAYGVTDTTGRKVLTVNSSINIASLTKPFTAVAIMLLKEQGKLDYDDRVIRYLPELPYANITIRQLLNHTTGLIDFMDWCNDHWDKTKLLTNEDILRIYAVNNIPLQFSPGEKEMYSNTNYAFLAVIIERVSGMKYPAFLQKNIFQPLHMANSYVYNLAMQQHPANYSQGFKWLNNKYYPNDLIWIDGGYGDGNMYSSVSDLYKFAKAIIGNGLLSAAAWTEAFTPAKLNDGSLSYYGFGFELDTGSIVSHGGHWVGFRSNFIVNKKTGNVIIAIDNSSSIYFWKAVAALQNILDEKPFALPAAKRIIPADITAYKDYAGRYFVTPAITITVANENGHLYAINNRFVHGNGSSKAELFPMAKDKFFMLGVEVDAEGLEFQFKRNEAGLITGFILHPYEEAPAKKLD